ncbi:integrase core domain-containing protein [Muricoccus nepalensis]|uniref:integrase core domain-containing protein n=1 Tax=Muricoccus nepalensis TaxID=1854500 RepID=UPI001386C9F0|nr:integrase core domain-containing protein [Roseomonas nepalensis]
MGERQLLHVPVAELGLHLRLREGPYPGQAQVPAVERDQTSRSPEIDDLTREDFVTRLGRQRRAADVIDASAPFIQRGGPGHVRSDNRPEFTAMDVKDWFSGVGARAAFINPGSPWKDDDLESVNGKLRDERFSAELFNTLAEAKLLIEQWRRHDNTPRPHSWLRYRPRGDSS